MGCSADHAPGGGLEICRADEKGGDVSLSAVICGDEEMMGCIEFAGSERRMQKRGSVAAE